MTPPSDSIEALVQTIAIGIADPGIPPKATQDALRALADRARGGEREWEFFRDQRDECVRVAEAAEAHEVALRKALEHYATLLAKSALAVNPSDA